jgi:hypothetical protein
MSSKKGTKPVPKPKGADSKALVVANQALQTVQKAVKKLEMRGGGKAKGPKGAKGVSAPASVSYNLPTDYFRFRAGSKPGSVIVEGRETIRKVVSQQNFVLAGEFSVNPCNEALFPILSNIADSFEECAWRDLRFSFSPQGSTQHDGSFMHYFDYDPADAAVVDELALLQNKTRDATAVWRPNTLPIDVKQIHRNRETFFVQSNIAVTNGQSLDAAEVRQNYAGTLRYYVHSGGEANNGAFRGYYTVQYAVELFVVRQKRQSAASWTGAALVAATNETVKPLGETTQTSVGLPGGPVVGATDSVFDTLSGYLIGAKQVYDSGQWLIGLTADASAAAAESVNHSSDGWESLSKKSLERKVGDEEATWTATCTYIRSTDPLSAEKWLAKRVQVAGPMAAGDFSVIVAAYDVSDGVIDPDFPITVVGMTFVESVTLAYAGAGAIADCGVNASFDVPAGSRYMFSRRFVTGATAGSGRTFSDVELTSVSASTTAP